MASPQGMPRCSYVQHNGRVRNPRKPHHVDKAVRIQTEQPSCLLVSMHNVFLGAAERGRQTQA